MKNQNLATVFVQIENASTQVESVADGILTAIKAAKATTLEQFNTMVTAAFIANNWSQKPGRPAPGSTERPAPGVVKLYVSNVRLAYRVGLSATAFDTIGALRAAVTARIRAQAQASRSERPAALRGLHVTLENAFNGALLHDVVVLYEHLPDDVQNKFENRLQRLIKDFVKEAPAELSAAA